MHARTCRSLLSVGTLLAGAMFCAAAPPPAYAQLGDLLKAPKTLFDRAIEARSAKDIATDNRIVIEVNGVMADLGTIKASTEIYEQRLLITGIFDDKKLYERFRAGVDAVKGIRKLYWHVVYLSEAEQKRRAKEMLDWADVLVLDTKAEAELIATRGVADVNFRIATDALGAVYLLGRARSGEERDKAIRTIRAVEGVKRVVDYVEVRP